MRIAFFSFLNLAYGGGFERYILWLAKELANGGNDISIVTADRKLHSRVVFVLSLFYLTPRLYFQDMFNLSENEIRENLRGVSLYEASSLKMMRRCLKNAEVIYSKNEFLDLSILKLLSYGGDLSPIVCGVHTPIYYPVTKSLYSKFHNSLYLSGIYKNLLKLCSAIHVVNSDQPQFIQRFFHGIKAKTHYIPYFFDVNDVKMEAARELTSKFNILFVGRLVEQKGIDILSDIIRSLSTKPEFEDMRFTIAGAGHLEPEILSLSKEYSNVYYKGWVDSKQMATLYLSNDISIVPSKWETVSYVCLESQSHGLPVVASNVPGPKDIIIENETGFLVEPENVEGFVNRILELYHLKNNDFERFKIMEEKARKNIERFSRNVIIPKLEAMFKEIVNGKGN